MPDMSELRKRAEALREEMRPKSRAELGRLLPRDGRAKAAAHLELADELLARARGLMVRARAHTPSSWQYDADAWFAAVEQLGINQGGDSG